MGIHNLLKIKMNHKLIDISIYETNVRRISIGLKPLKIRYVKNILKNNSLQNFVSTLKLKKYKNLKNGNKIRNYLNETKFEMIYGKFNSVQKWVCKNRKK